MTKSANPAESDAGIGTAEVPAARTAIRIRSARCFSVVLVILMCDRNRAQVGVIHCAGCKALSKIAGEAGGCHFNVWPNKHGLEVGARASKPRWPARVRAACNKHVRVAEVEKERLRVKVVLCLLHPELSRIDELRTNPLGAATELDGLGVDDHLDRGAGPTGLQRFKEGVLGIEERPMTTTRLGAAGIAWSSCSSNDGPLVDCPSRRMSESFD